jgi:hypothetical protein
LKLLFIFDACYSASAPPPAPEEVIEALVKRSLTDKEKGTIYYILYIGAI